MSVASVGCVCVFWIFSPPRSCICVGILFWGLERRESKECLKREQPSLTKDRNLVLGAHGSSTALFLLRESSPMPGIFSPQFLSPRLSSQVGDLLPPPFVHILPPYGTAQGHSPGLDVLSTLEAGWRGRPLCGPRPGVSLLTCLPTAHHSPPPRHGQSTPPRPEPRVTLGVPGS